MLVGEFTRTFSFFKANFPFLWNVLRAFAMRTQNAANYALLEDKIVELVKTRLENIRQDEEKVLYTLFP